MKLINSSFEFVEQGEGKLDVFKHIEKCGRVSYKSEDKITDDSANEFVGRRIAAGHTAILEQATIYLEFPHLNMGKYATNDFSIDPKILRYIDNPYSKVVTTDKASFVTTNYRVLYENGWLDDLYNMCSPRSGHEPRVTVKFICSRAIANELVRHRVFSFVQESTRFCNYSKERFDGELSFIKPNWYDKEKDTLLKQLYNDTLYNTEQTYLALIKGGFRAQEARGILINDLKTELCMTGYVSDWFKLFELRDNTAAHPDMVELMHPLHQIFRQRWPDYDTNS